MTDETSIDELAEEDLGITRLRSGQRAAIEAAVAGRDVLAVMPTGYGKSAIYQLAGAEIDGPTLVVSPLIALQRDQIAGLEDTDVGDAVEINASISESARAEALDRLRHGDVEFAFLAPEQLAREDTLDALRSVGPSLVVVDEAHCISSWGHDFRPDYLRLGEVIEALGHPVVIALTATAAPPVQAEIVDRLGMRDPEVIVGGFDRPNIRLEVVGMLAATTEQKDAAVVDRVVDLAAGGAPGIVYVATRARSETLADALADRGVVAAAYHAGLASRRRNEVHEGFMTGATTVVVATTAFGMGVDKPDVRFVVHADVPDSLDSYSQETGRAGRDGDAADAVLFYRPEDLGVRRFLGRGGSVEPADALAVVDALDAGPASESELADRLEMPERRLRRVLSRLLDLQVIRRAGDEINLRDAVDRKAVASAVLEADERREQFEATRLEMMRGYAEARTCRRRALLSYFGDQTDGDCDHCDICERRAADEPAAARVTAADDPFAPGATVAHPEWGDGEVIRVEGDTVVVLFTTGGYRSLSRRLVAERDLLERR